MNEINDDKEKRRTIWNILLAHIPQPDIKLYKYVIDFSRHLLNSKLFFIEQTDDTTGHNSETRVIKRWSVSMIAIEQLFLFRCGWCIVTRNVARRPRVETEPENVSQDLCEYGGTVARVFVPSYIPSNPWKFLSFSWNKGGTIVFLSLSRLFTRKEKRSNVCIHSNFYSYIFELIDLNE